MENDNLGIPLIETLEEFKTYIENQVKYNKLLITKRAEEFSSFLILFILVLGFSGLVLLFLSFAFAGWFADLTNLSIGTGYLVVAGFYIGLIIIVLVYRKRFIYNPIRKLFGTIFFSEDESVDNSGAFASSQTLADNIKKARDEVTQQYEVLDQKINDLGKILTFSNIAYQLVGKAYSSLMTTSNVAVFAIKLIKRLKWFTSSKSKKKRKIKTASY
jgi:hypothetical protein